MLQPATVFEGVGYVASIRDTATGNNKFNQPDLLHVVAYFAKHENLNYADIRTLVEGDHNLTFFTNKIDRTATRFTWEQAQNKLRSNTVQGDACQVFHDRPLTFGEFVDMAYAGNILSDGPAYQIVASKVPGMLSQSRNPKDSFMPPLNIDQISSSQAPNLEKILMFTDKVGGLGIMEETVGGNYAVGENANDGVSEEVVWRQRALLAEARVKKLEEMVLDKDKIILTLKSKLTSADEASVRFSANADLAAELSKQYQKDATLPIVAGLKEELKVLPKVYDLLEKLGTKVDKLDGVPEMVSVLKEIADQATTKMKRHEEFLENMGDDSDMETAISLLTRTNKVLELYGFSSSSAALNVPETLASLRDSVLVPAAVSTPVMGSGFLPSMGVQNPTSGQPPMQYVPASNFASGSGQSFSQDSGNNNLGGMQKFGTPQFSPAIFGNHVQRGGNLGHSKAQVSHDQHDRGSYRGKHGHRGGGGGQPEQRDQREQGWQREQRDNDFNNGRTEQLLMCFNQYLCLLDTVSGSIN